MAIQQYPQKTLCWTEISISYGMATEIICGIDGHIWLGTITAEVMDFPNYERSSFELHQETWKFSNYAEIWAQTYEITIWDRPIRWCIQAPDSWTMPEQFLLTCMDFSTALEVSTRDYLDRNVNNVQSNVLQDDWNSIMIRISEDIIKCMEHYWNWLSKMQHHIFKTESKLEFTRHQ